MRRCSLRKRTRLGAVVWEGEKRPLWYHPRADEENKQEMVMCNVDINRRKLVVLF
jgi:hypothetical protein